MSPMEMTWGEAHTYCRRIGGYQAEIMSKEEEAILDTFLVGGISYWLGLTDLKNEGTKTILAFC